jgi:hypothetical protein
MQEICSRSEADDELRQMIIKRLINGWRVGILMAKAGKLIYKASSAELGGLRKGPN